MSLARFLLLRTERFLTDRKAEALNEELGRHFVREASGHDGPLPAYRGTVSEKGFEITRFNAYGGTIMPHVRGRFVPSSGKTEVRLFYRPHREVLLFSLIWYTFLAVVTLLIVLSSGGGRSYRLLFIALPLGLTVFSWLLTVTVFESDCRWARKSLEETLFPLRREGPEGTVKS